MNCRITLLALALFPLAASASGNHMMGNTPGMPGMSAGQPNEIDRTIDITMDDQMRFSPDHLSVKAGQTIRFAVKNVGVQTHEMVIGSLDELEEHAEEMRLQPDMAHDDPNMIQLAGGETGEIVWQFTEPGRVAFACLLPGHFEAGMKGSIEVLPTP
ncbi:MAG: cupredoxin family protein [Halothiobacillaceae bacterium]